MPTNLKRRHFLHGSVIAGAGAAALPKALHAAETPAGPGSGRATLETDVLICGGGCAGTAAALSAARSGARTLLIEKAPFAGGIITSVGLPYFDGIADIKDNTVVVRGIALELLSKTGVCAPDATRMAKHNPTIPNTFEFMTLLDRELTAQNDHNCAFTKEQ